jgi:hypothetical protein
VWRWLACDVGAAFSVVKRFVTFCTLSRPAILKYCRCGVQLFSGGIVLANKCECSQYRPNTGQTYVYYIAVSQRFL